MSIAEIDDFWAPHLATIRTKLQATYPGCRIRIQVNADDDVATPEPVTLQAIGPEGNNAVLWQAVPFPGVTSVREWLAWQAAAPTSS